MTSTNAIEKAYALLAASDSSRQLQHDGVSDAVHAATEEAPPQDIVQQVIDAFGSDSAVSLAALRRLLLSGWLHRKHKGRYWVAVSLAEAETLRRIMHIRSNCALVAEQNVQCALRYSPGAVMVKGRDVGGRIIDASQGWRQAGVADTEATAYEEIQQHACFRFVDGDMHYSKRALLLLLKALQGSSTHQRQAYPNPNPNPYSNPNQHSSKASLP